MRELVLPLTTSSLSVTIVPLASAPRSRYRKVSWVEVRLISTSPCWLRVKE